MALGRVIIGRYFYGDWRFGDLTTGVVIATEHRLIK